jgi:hypothetical protein
LRDAGLTDIRQKPVLMVRVQPLRPVERRHNSELLKFVATRALALDLPADDRAIWAQLADIESPNHILNHPDYLYRCIQTVFVGRVPDSASV